MPRASLRIRIFLFFALNALAGCAIVAGALWIGHARGPGGYVTAGIVAAFGLCALSAGIWLLFDENVARPLESLAANLRGHAHAGGGAPVDPRAARYLGDLAPAARALTEKLSSDAMDTATRVAQETERLARERRQLEALLSESPTAMIMIGADGSIVLYDGQAADILARHGQPRLGAPASDYFDTETLSAGLERSSREGRERGLTLPAARGDARYHARLKPLGEGAALLMLDPPETTLAPDVPRPLVFDFDLLDRPVPRDLGTARLPDLCFAVFDTETTGLLPHRDEIVQIGAVRVLGGRIVEAERLDLLVDPGMPIPPQSTRVHGVTDAMVAGQPGIVTAARRFHDFARGAVIVAHNAPFDMAFLRRHDTDTGLDWEHPILDTVLLSAVLYGTTESHTLDALCARLGVEIPPNQRHSALGDAEATARALVRMLPMLEARGLATLDAVIGETRRHGRLLRDLN